MALLLDSLVNTSRNCVKFMTGISNNSRSVYYGRYQQHCRYMSRNRLRSDTPFRRSQAQELVIRLSPSERSILLQELQTFDKDSHQHSQEPITSDALARPTSLQLLGVASHNAIPFIGFGFLDNFIMIVAGDYIDLTIGASLGISTLAAAALGNLVSDVAGVGSAWYVESLSARIGVRAPVLTPEQLSMNSTTWCIYLGRALGVSLGCLLGMIPLLFLRKDKKKES